MTSLPESNIGAAIRQALSDERESARVPPFAELWQHALRRRRARIGRRWSGGLAAAGLVAIAMAVMLKPADSPVTDIAPDPHWQGPTDGLVTTGNEHFQRDLPHFHGQDITTYLEQSI